MQKRDIYGERKYQSPGENYDVDTVQCSEGGGASGTEGDPGL